MRKIMKMKELQAMMCKEKRQEYRVKVAKMLTVKVCTLVVVSLASMAIGICIASNHKDKIEKLKKKASDTVEEMKDATQKGAKIASEKTAHMKEEIKGGYQEMKTDIHDAVENISDDLKTRF